MLTPEQIADGWIAHDGGKLAPVAGDTIVAVMYRGDEDASKGVRIPYANASRLTWWHDGADDDIIAYRAEKAHDPAA